MAARSKAFGVSRQRRKDANIVTAGEKSAKSRPPSAWVTSNRGGQRKRPPTRRGNTPRHPRKPPATRTRQSQRGPGHPAAEMRLPFGRLPAYSVRHHSFSHESCRGGDKLQRGRLQTSPKMLATRVLAHDATGLPEPFNMVSRSALELCHRPITYLSLGLLEVSEDVSESHPFLPRDLVSE